MSQPTTGPEKYDLTVTRVFGAPVEDVWKAWTESEQVKRWWGPHGFTCRWPTWMSAKAGIAGLHARAEESAGRTCTTPGPTARCQPHQRLEFILNFADKDGNKLDPATLGLPPGIPQDVPHVITFKPLGDGRTEMTITEYGYTSGKPTTRRKPASTRSWTSWRRPSRPPSEPPVVQGSAALRVSRRFMSLGPGGAATVPEHASSCALGGRGSCPYAGMFRPDRSFGRHGPRIECTVCGPRTTTGGRPAAR